MTTAKGRQMNNVIREMIKSRSRLKTVVYIMLIESAKLI